MYMYACMCVCLYVCLYVYVCIYTYTRIHIPSKIYTQIRRTHEICRWEPFKTPLIGPAAHPCLSAPEAASIFRTILREPYQGKNVMGRAGVEQGRGGEVEAAGPGVRLGDGTMDFRQYRRALELLALRLGVRLRMGVFAVGVCGMLMCV